MASSSTRKKAGQQKAAPFGAQTKTQKKAKKKMLLFFFYWMGRGILADRFEQEEKNEGSLFFSSLVAKRMACDCFYCAHPQILYCNGRPKRDASFSFPLVIRHAPEVGGKGMILVMEGREGPFCTKDGLRYASLDEATDALYRRYCGVAGRRKRVWCNEVWSVNVQNKFSVPLKDLDFEHAVFTNATTPVGFVDRCSMSDGGSIFKYCKKSFFSGELQHLVDPEGTVPLRGVKKSGGRAGQTSSAGASSSKRQISRLPGAAAKAPKRGKKAARESVVDASSEEEEEEEFDFDVSYPACKWEKADVEKFCLLFPHRAPALLEICEVIAQKVGNPRCRVKMLHPVTEEPVELILSSSVLVWTEPYERAAREALRRHKQEQQRQTTCDVDMF